MACFSVDECINKRNKLVSNARQDYYTYNINVENKIRRLMEHLN